VFLDIILNIKSEGVKVLNIVKVRLYPNEEQKAILEKTFGSVRFVYNQMLEKKSKHMKKIKPR